MRYFNQYTDILVCRGNQRVLLTDLGRNKSDLYPLEMADLLEELKNSSIEKILTHYDEESREIVEEYIAYFQEQEYGFISLGDWDSRFQSLPMHYEEPIQVNNIFMERLNLQLEESLISSIQNLGVKHLVIHCLGTLRLEDFLMLEEQFKDSRLEGIEVYCPYHEEITEAMITQLHHAVKRIYNLVFFNCQSEPVISEDFYKFSLFFVPVPLTINSCGKVSLEYFNSNITKISEAMNFNSCLHLKMGIDLEGNIRNCPAMPEQYGNIKDQSLEEALSRPDFKKYWNLTKDEVNICKDCEFRYVCTDCRAFTERNSFSAAGLDVSKPLKCGYDPYDSSWSEWSTNPLKEKAMAYYHFAAVRNESNS